MNKQSKFRWLPIVVLLFLVRIAQPQSIPTLLPAYSNNFNDYSTFPSICFIDVLQDSTGKLWLTTCGAFRVEYGIPLFHFDGYNFNVAKLGLNTLGTESKVVGLLSENKMAGYRTRQRLEKDLFIYDIAKDQLQLTALDIEGDLVDANISETGDFFFVIYRNKQCFLYQWTFDDYQYLGVIDAPKQSARNKIQVGWHDQSSIWYSSIQSEYFFHFDKTNERFEKYSLKTLFEGITTDQHFFPTFFRYAPFKVLEREEGIYAVASIDTRRQIFKKEPGSDQFKTIEGIPSNWYGFFIQKDAVNNLLMLFLDEEKKVQAILQDPSGRRYNYSAFFEGITANKIRQIRSENFKEQLFILSNRGLEIKVVKDKDALLNFFPNISIRGIVEHKPNQFLIGTQKRKSLFLDLANRTASKTDVLDCIVGHPLRTRNFKDKAGVIWMPDKDHLLRYDPKLGTCERLPTGISQIKLFVFLDDQNVFCVSNLNQLFIYNIQTGQTTPFNYEEQNNRIPHRAQDILLSTSGTVWLACIGGLWEIDTKNQTATLQEVQAFQDNRFLCIHEDEKGGLWLGTSLAGIHIYDPDSKEVKVIDDQQGLPGNTVVTIIADQDGDRWAGTYNGMALLSPEGQILSSISEEDGLIDREFNRYACYLSDNGDVLMGTVNGLNVIRPKQLKGWLNRTRDPKIYLTGLEYFNSSLGKDTLQTYGLVELDEITLPATKRYLRLSFSMSNYVKPEENHYAYKFEGKSEDWILLDNNHRLNFNDLPAGKYQLLVKGIDPFGNQTAEPLRIAIHAKAFFYQQIWFYLLLLGLLGGLSLIWIFRLRRAVRKATTQIRQDKELIENQANRLQELDQAKSRFFTNISHEFRTPLTVIGGVVQQLEQKIKSLYPKELNLIQRNNQNLLNLVNQILDLRKLESGKLTVNYIQGDIIIYLRYILESFHSYASSKEIQLKFESDQPTFWMDYDEEKLLRIITNLLSNAIKFTEPGGGDVVMKVWVKDQFEIEIVDHGRGIAKEKLDNIFNRFYQTDTSSNKHGEGTGIGLALVQELVHLMNGQISVQSELYKGSTFRIQLPIRQNAEKLEPENILKKTLVSQVGELNGHPNIMVPEASTQNLPSLLIIEDNQDIVQYMQGVLAPSYQIFVAYDGAAGIKLALEKVPDLIISDVMMPEKDGFEVCETLKQDIRTSHIPIILLTAKIDDQSRLLGLRQGADAYLPKPFNQEELLVRLEKLLELRQGLQARYAGLQIPDTPSSEATQQEDAFLQEVRDIVMTHLDDAEFSVPDLCKKIGMSRTQLHRKMKALTNASTTRFIRVVRVQEAQKLLKNSDLNITQVAFEVGFKDPSYFSKVFTQESGVSPSDFVKN